MAPLFHTEIFVIFLYFFPVLRQSSRTYFFHHLKQEPFFVKFKNSVVAGEKVVRHLHMHTATSQHDSHQWAVADPCLSSRWDCSISQSGRPSGQRGRPPPPAPPLCALPGCRRGGGSGPGCCGPSSPWRTARNAHQSGPTGSAIKTSKEMYIYVCHFKSWNEISFDSMWMLPCWRPGRWGASWRWGRSHCASLW